MLSTKQDKRYFSVVFPLYYAVSVRIILKYNQIMQICAIILGCIVQLWCRPKVICVQPHPPRHCQQSPYHMLTFYSPQMSFVAFCLSVTSYQTCAMLYISQCSPSWLPSAPPPTKITPLMRPHYFLYTIVGISSLEPPHLPWRDHLSNKSTNPMQNRWSCKRGTTVVIKM